jgi:two-component system sensor histidine kinase VanS
LRNDFSRLKTKIFFQVLLVALATGVVGLIVIKFFIDGILQEPFADGFIGFCKKILRLDEYSAFHLYTSIFRSNKDTLITILFILLLLVFFYFAMTRFTRYFDQISDGVDKLLDESEKPITLMKELNFMEAKLNAVKETLKQRKKSALESEQKKNDLIVYLAHDLKTPLTSVIGYLSLLNEIPEMPLEQRAKYTSISLKKAQRLEDLINEFFDIIRYNLENISLEKEEINLSRILMQLADEFYPLFVTKNIKVDMSLEDSILIFGDADKLARVFSNILRNAVTYSYENSIVELLTKKENNFVSIVFRNRGKQIPAHKLETIFEKFYRLDLSRSSESGNAGLGLAIAKEIVTLHNGTIAVSSNEEYTEFSVKLPV